MVLISIHPFAFRKVFLVIAALLCFSALCFADPVLMAQRYSASGADAEFNRDAFTDFQRVDLPTRGLELLPSKDSLDKSLSRPEFLFPDSEGLDRGAESA